MFRVNGKLVALKVIRLQEEEGTPFTAIREGENTERTESFSEQITFKQISDFDVDIKLFICLNLYVCFQY